MVPFVLALFGNVGAGEILLILAVILLFFGAAKIPELARALGKAKGEFEKGSREGRTAPADPVRDAPTLEAAEEARVLKAARELGIPTEGRSVADIKADLRGRLG